jgi:hypothetical protein
VGRVFTINGADAGWIIGNSIRKRKKWINRQPDMLITAHASADVSMDYLFRAVRGSHFCLEIALKKAWKSLAVLDSAGIVRERISQHLFAPASPAYRNPLPAALKPAAPRFSHLVIFDSSNELVTHGNLRTWWGRLIPERGQILRTPSMLGESGIEIWSF